MDVNKLLSPRLETYLENVLPAVLGAESKITEAYSSGGGSINRAVCFTYAKKKFFVKINQAKKFPGMFSLEEKGLKLLEKGEELVIPKVILNGIIDDEQFLVLEFLESDRESKEFFHALGKGLAALHTHTQENFGLDHNNYIGSLPQTNTLTQKWSEFFISQRMEPLLKKAVDTGELPSNCASNFNGLFKKLDEIFPNEKPALLHGDLWTGNKMSTNVGPSIFDPAVYYGHREVDLAMTKLFGGFDPAFYKGYHEAFPPEKGWEERVDIFNLYPLLVHVNLFGGGYAGDVISIIDKF